MVYSGVGTTGAPGAGAPLEFLAAVKVWTPIPSSAHTRAVCTTPGYGWDLGTRLGGVRVGMCMWVHRLRLMHQQKLTFFPLEEALMNPKVWSVSILEL